MAYMDCVGWIADCRKFELNTSEVSMEVILSVMDLNVKGSSPL